jgi:Tfp pilus assembly protein PilZ
MEKRRQPRFVVEGLHGNVMFSSPVEVLNMSLSGCALRVERRLTIGLSYVLRLELEDKNLEAGGLIVWCTLDQLKKRNGEDIPSYTAGMKFVDVLSDRVQELRSFIKANSLLPEKRVGGVRFQLSAPGKVLVEMPQAYDVKVLSLAGMLIETDQALNVEEYHPMEMTLDNGNPLRFSGRIVYCTPAPADQRRCFHVGIEFVGMPDEESAQLDAFLRALPAS